MNKKNCIILIKSVTEICLDIYMYLHMYTYVHIKRKRILLLRRNCRCDRTFHEKTIKLL